MNANASPIETEATDLWSERLGDEPAREAQRLWAAERMLELAPLVRNRLRRKLDGGARRLFDSQDLMSTVLRRVDRLAAEGRLRAQSDEELISLLFRVSDRVLIDRYRVLGKLRRVEGEDSEWAQSLLTRLDRATDETGKEMLTEIFQSLESADDRILFSLWLRDVPHVVIAQTMGISPEAARQRWSVLRRRLAAYGAQGGWHE